MISVIGSPVSPTSYSAATAEIMSWARAGESRYVAVATAQTLMEAHDSGIFREVIRHADLVTPDGMPLVWMLRLKGERGQGRVYGPALMLQILRAAETAAIPVGLYGSSAEVLGLLRHRLMLEFPQLHFAYSYSPPFRELSAAEDDQIAQEIRKSGARILFVGLGCPKQERWMAMQRSRIPVVMIGVGAAFDFLAGSKRQAPAWLQRAGLEWLFRLLHEPRRLWRRYLINNPRFVVLALAELMGFRSA